VSEREVFGKRFYDSTCARCGVPIKALTPDNDDLEVCSACTRAIQGELVRHE